MVGKYLKRARKEAGYKSAFAYAEHLGISKYTYTSYEQDDRDVPVSLLIQIAKDLGITVDYLIGMDEEDALIRNDKQD